MLAYLEGLRKKVTVGVVGGSDEVKIKEQLGDDAVANFDYFFAENGLIAYKDGQSLPSQSLVKHLGEDKVQELINFTLGELAQIKLPFKRGNFIEFRTGMLNVSPVGRSVSQQERNDFNAYDNEHKVRQALLEKLDAKFGDAFGLKFSIGGQISMDIFPRGWDKTYCLQHVEKDGPWKEIHFFGDKTSPGGNDHEIFASDKTIGHTVTSPADTIAQLTELFGA